MYVLMMSKRNHLIVIIKRGENVNVCIHDFDDAKEETNKALLQDFFKIKPCLKTKGFKIIQGSWKLEVGNCDFNIIYFPFLCFLIFGFDKGVALALTYPQVR